MNHPPNFRFPSPGELLPHRPPMLLLRAVVAHAPDMTRCEAGFSSRFVEACGGEVTAAFGLEMIAQAAAVHHALRQRTETAGHIPAVRGLLLGSRRLRLECRSLPTTRPLHVVVTGGQEPPGPGGLIRFEGRVEDADGGVLVNGDATVLEWRPDEQAV